MLPYYNDATMWGPQGDPNKERPRLKPGDRLADGKVFMGDSPEAVLLAELERVDDALKPLLQEQTDIMRKLHELDPEKYLPVMVGVEAETETKTSPAVSSGKKKTSHG